MPPIIAVQRIAVAQLDWEVSSPAAGVVLIDVRIGGDCSAVPLHWRIGDWTKPPLDLEFNPANGLMQALQFVLQDERVTPYGLKFPSDVEDGIPVLDIRGWPADRYRDERGIVRIGRSSADEVVLILGSGHAIGGMSIGDRLKLAYDRSGLLCEIRIGPLSSKDWTIVDSCAFVE